PDRDPGKGVTVQRCHRLMLRCGLRVSEVSNLRWEAIAMPQGTLRVHNRKGPVDRMVYTGWGREVSLPSSVSGGGQRVSILPRADGIRVYGIQQDTGCPLSRA